MRLARPVYESMPLIYAAIGVVATGLAALDPQGSESVVAIVIAVVAEIAALTIFLRRQDYRALRNEYSGETIEFPSRLNG